MRPGPDVLAAFGARADPVPLPGGEGTAWRAGEVVLKPAGDPRVARWTADLYQDLDPLGSPTARRDPGFRVPRPLRTIAGDRVAGDRVAGDRAAGDRAAGDWVAGDPVTGGWVAWQWLPGEPASWAGVSPFWPRLIAASRAFHAALAGRPAPPWLGRDGSPWTAGDQVAWGERDPESVLAAAPGSLAGQLRRLLAALRPVRLPSQLIHGDLGGNVLFAGASPPAVIDFSPYWRPAGLALAVAAVDALMWGGASPAALGELDGQPELDQLLARALVYRLVTEIVFRRGGPDPATGLETVARTSRPVTALVLARLTPGTSRGHSASSRDTP
jgi:Phosphotransferase enzyme family